MRRARVLLLAVVMVGSFFIFQKTFSANADIIINEIGAYATNTHEWVELWNRGSEAVDIREWKFWENNTNHGLSAASSTDNFVGPGEYAAIAQDSVQFLLDYPSFSGSIFDSSWGSLNEEGEEIGLRDENGNTVEQFVYQPAQDHSLERRDSFISDYTSVNWQEHADGNTLGAVNSIFASIASSSTSTIPEEPAPTSTSVVETPASTASSTSDFSTGTIWSRMKINEIMVNSGSADEWVELYNPTTSSLDLTGGILCDSRTSTTCVIAAPTTTIMPLGWMVIYFSSSRLNNSGDSVILKKADGTIIDQVRYGGGNAGVPGAGQTLARKSDGGDSDNDNMDWSITTQLTPGSANMIVEPFVPTSGGGGSAYQQFSQINQQQTQATTTIVCRDWAILRDASAWQACPVSTVVTGTIFLNEIFPNPLGSDSNDEFIEIKNSSTQAIDLRGWKLADSSGSFNLYGTISPGQLIIWTRRVTRISLNNTGREEIKLYNAMNAVVDSIIYTSAPEGQSYNRNEEGVWQWSARSTPGQMNIVIVPDTTRIVWKINAPSRAEPGEMLVFDAEDSADPRGGTLSFVWNFGDGATAPGGEVEHVFATSGVYSITVSAISSAGTGGEKSFTVNVGQGLSIVNSFIILNEVVPNPDGDDSREFIELYNSGSSTADVSGWLLRHQSKIFQIPSGTRVAPQGFLVFYRAVTRFSLGNSGDKVELLSPDREAVDMIRFGKALSGMSYGLGDGEWKWVNQATPGQMNAMMMNDNDNEGIKDKIIGNRTIKSRAKSAKTVAYIPIGIAQAREQEKDTGVKARGAVSVKPGIFGSQYFYITDGDAGIQVYQYKKDFPDLEVGDLIEVKGLISEANGQKRIRLKGKSDIDILETGRSIRPSSSTIGEVEEQSVGKLVSIEGEITEIKSNFLYIDDGEGEIMVYFKKGARLDKKKIKEGENARVTGIVEENKNGVFQLWPRSQEDIVSMGLSEDLLKKQTVLGQDRQKETAEKYLTATAGGITTLLFGFLARARGAVLRAGVKKVASLASRFISKG